MRRFPTQIPLPPASSGVSVCAGFDHACVVTNDGQVYVVFQLRALTLIYSNAATVGAETLSTSAAATSLPMCLPLSLCAYQASLTPKL